MLLENQSVQRRKFPALFSFLGRGDQHDLVNATRLHLVICYWGGQSFVRALTFFYSVYLWQLSSKDRLLNLMLRQRLLLRLKVKHRIPGDSKTVGHRI
jgi:hypothetical protein